jgi:hypothetical protein
MLGLRQVQPVPTSDADSTPRSEERVLAYFSRKLHGAETRYSTYDKELLAIKDALKHWWYYLLGRKTKIWCAFCLGFRLMVWDGGLPFSGIS